MGNIRKVMLIGGNGFIGSHLADALLSHSIAVRIFDKQPELFRNPLREIEYFFGDITNFSALKETVNGCDTIVYLVHSFVPTSVLNKTGTEFCDSVNHFIKLLHCLEKSTIERIVYFSSGGAVYGNPQYVPVPEHHPLDPVSPYGVAKVTMEKYLQMFCRLNGKQYLIIRPSNPYGPRQNFKGNQGVIPIFMDKILNNRPVILWGCDSICKDYIFVKDLARATLELLLGDIVNHVFNIGMGAGTSLKELIALIEIITGEKATITMKQPVATDVTNIILDCTKYRSTTGSDACTTNLQDGMRETYRWLLNEQQAEKR